MPFGRECWPPRRWPWPPSQLRAPGSRPDRAAPPPSAKAAHGKAHAFKKPKVKHGELQVTGTSAGDTIALRLKAGDPAVIEVDVGDDGSADFSFDRAEITRIAIDARDGDDSVRIDEAFGVFTDAIPTTIDGGDGNDRLAGGSGAETLIGGEGNDSIDGNRGNDVARMGSGDDTFVWDPGDGSDVVEGESGTDTMLFNGANVAEQVDLSANGSRLRFTRDIGTITMDIDGVETVDFNALGGADTVDRPRPRSHRRDEREHRSRRDRRRRRRPDRQRARRRHERQRHDQRRTATRPPSPCPACRALVTIAARRSRPTSSPSTGAAATTRSRRPTSRPARSR